MPSKVHVSRAQIDQFTSIVRLPPDRLLSPPWLEEQEHNILTLQPSLLRPRNFAARIMEHFSHDKATLCYQHRKLNCLIVRKLFEYIQRECFHMIKPFKRHPTPPQHPSIQAWKKRIIAINSLWTERETFYHIHDAKEGDPVYKQVKGDCEACILATIGGDRGMLTDLYISAHGRGSLDRRSQPTCQMVEGWLSALSILEEVYQTTKPLYRLIRSERTRMQRERREHRRAKNQGRPFTAPGRPPRPEERQRMDDEAAEEEKSEIIDLYVHRLSTMPGFNPYNKQPNDSRLSLHPAIRSHIGYDAATGKYSRVEPENSPPVPKIVTGNHNNAGLGRSNTTISRDSRNDPGAWEVYRSDSPVSDASRHNSPDRHRRRTKSNDASEYSGSIYSRAAADPQPYDSGYHDSSSVLSDRDRQHDLNLRMNPTNGDIGGPRSPPSPPEVDRHRNDAYSDLVGMPSAYEFGAAEKLKTLYEFEPYSDDELEIGRGDEQKSLGDTKTETDRYVPRLANREGKAVPHGRTREDGKRTEGEGRRERRGTQ